MTHHHSGPADSTTAFGAKNGRKKAHNWTFCDWISKLRSKSAGGPGKVLSAVVSIWQEQQQYCIGLEDAEHIPDVHISRQNMSCKQVNLEWRHLFIATAAQNECRGSANKD